MADANDRAGRHDADDRRDDEDGGRGAGRKHDVQRPPGDQRSAPDPKEDEGPGAP